MIRKDVMRVISKYVGINPIISANGFISRDLFEIEDKNSNFYMIGSMGLASSIALGVSLENPKNRIFIFDGDGNILMNLGSLTTIGVNSPKNLVHIVFDNNIHESTGGQPTNSLLINLDKIANVAKYRSYRITNMRELENILKKIPQLKGPLFILIKIDKNKQVSRRIDISPEEIKIRFMDFLKK